MGWAEFAAGLVGGAAQAGVDTIIEQEKAKIQRDRDMLLSELRKKEYEHQLDAKESSDAKYADARIARDAKKIGAEEDAKAAATVRNMPGLTQAQIDAARAKAPVELEIAGAKKRQDKDIEGEYQEQDAKGAGMKAKAEAEAKHPFEMARIREAAEEARRTRRDDDSREKYIDEDGNYRRKSDDQIITDVQREGGRELSRTPVKAPKSKVDGTRESPERKDEKRKAEVAWRSAEAEYKSTPSKANRDKRDAALKAYENTLSPDEKSALGSDPLGLRKPKAE